MSLFIVNTRAAYYFVLALVSPRELPEPRPAAEPAAAARRRARPAGYTVRVGPLVATVEPGSPWRRTGAVGPGHGPPTRDRRAGPAAARPSRARSRPCPAAHRPGSARRSGPSSACSSSGSSSSGGVAAVGFVIAVKTIARFKQLDDRGFAEYYLLGTLASVSVAICALVAKAALGTIP